LGEQDDVSKKPGVLGRIAGHRRLHALRGDGLKARAIRGSSWTLAGIGIQQVMKLGSNLILTRLLFPEAFGLMALAYVFMTGLEMFSDMGIRPSIIQNKRGEDPDFLNTAWTMGVIRGFVLWMIAIAISYPISVMYEKPVLFPMLIVIGSTAAIRGFQSTGFATSSRKLQLGKLTGVELTTQAIGIVTMIAWASVWPTVWAIVVGGVVSSVLSVLLGHRVLSTHRHRFRWDRDAARELIRFGRWIFLSSAITFFAQSGDQVMLPKLLSIQELSYYSLALTLARIPIMFFGKISAKVLFPLYSNVAKDGGAKRINEVSRKFAKLSWPMYLIPIVFMFFSNQIVGVLYDPRYAETGWALSVLAIGAYLRMMKLNQDGLLLAIGKSREHMLTNVVRLGSWVPFVILFAPRWGLMGFCAGIVISDAMTLMTQHFFVRRSIPGLSSRVDLTLITVLLAAVSLMSVVFTMTL
jgi:O-antigen/teichoic acid export membrane protein